MTRGLTIEVPVTPESPPNSAIGEIDAAAVRLGVAELRRRRGSRSLPPLYRRKPLLIVLLMCGWEP